MRKIVWLSFDLSLNGDYEGLFKWLDEHSAEECGDGLACFYFNFAETNQNDTEDEAELLASLEADVSIRDKKDRIYVVWKKRDDRVKGCFLTGRRKRAPWEGAAGLTTEDQDG